MPVITKTDGSEIGGPPVPFPAHPCPSCGYCHVWTTASDPGVPGVPEESVVPCVSSVHLVYLYGDLLMARQNIVQWCEDMFRQDTDGARAFVCARELGHTGACDSPQAQEVRREWAMGIWGEKPEEASL